MPTAPDSLTVEEYLRLERASDVKHEYANGRIFAMAGANRAHRALTINIETFLFTHLASDCIVDNSEARLFIPSTGRFTYADVVLTCEEQRYYDDGLDTLLNPNLIVEVLSPTTEAYDRGPKFRLYQSIPSFREYLLVSQERALVEHYIRNQDESWTYRAFELMDESVRLECGIAIRLTAIYQGVTLSNK